MKKRNVQLVLFSVIFLMIFSASVRAEIILLRSGRRVNGDIIKETDTYVVVDKKGLQLTFLKGQVKDILRENPQEETASIDDNPAGKIQKSTVKKQPDAAEVKKSVPKVKPQQAQKKVPEERLPAREVDESVPVIGEELFVSEDNIYAMMLANAFRKIIRIKTDMESFLAGYTEILHKSYAREDQSYTMDVLLKGTRYMEDLLKEAGTIPDEKDLSGVKTAMLKYYQKLILLQSIALRSFVIEDQQLGEDLKRASREVDSWEQKFLEEFSRLSAKYSKADLSAKDVEGSLALDIKDTETVKKKYLFLVEQMKDLVSSNKTMQEQNQLLLKDNHMLKENLEQYLKSDLHRLDIQQKRDLLQYLRRM